jgi:hypothetical protein
MAGDEFAQDVGAFAGNPEIPEIATSGQAYNYVVSIIEKVEAARLDCDVTFPDDKARTVRWQTRAFRKFLFRWGAALATLATFRMTRCPVDGGDGRYLSSTQFMELRQRVMVLMAPRVVGSTSVPPR